MSRLALVACAVGVGILPSLAQSSELIAHYPLSSDALDATGNYDPIMLDNAPFEEGGVYCNGIYTHHPGGCRVETPYLSAIDFESLSISAQFKIPATYDAFHPILVGGDSWRWMGAEISEILALHFLYNDNLLATGVVVTPDVWHRVFISYDGATDTGYLYLDEVEVASQVFVMVHNEDRDISTSHFGGGRTFLGHFKDLRVYDGAFVPTPVESSTWGRVKRVFATPKS